MALPKALGGFGETASKLGQAFGLGGKGSSLAQLTNLLTGKSDQKEVQKNTGYTEVVSVLNKILALLELKLTEIARGGIGSGSTALGPDALKKLGGQSPGGALGSSAMALLGDSAKVTPTAPSALGTDAMAKLAGSAGGATKAVAPLAEGLGGLAGKLNPAIAVIQGVIGALGHVVGAFGEVKNAITSLGNAVAPFVKMANPGLVQKFTMASDDLTAVMGRALIPIMEFATQNVRMFADAFMALSGPLSRAFSSRLGEISKMFQSLFRTLEPVIDVLGAVWDAVSAIARPLMILGGILQKSILFPLELGLRLIAELMKPVLGLIEAFATLFGDLMEIISSALDKVLQDIRDFFGIKTIAGKSVGAAVRPASIGSIEDYGKRAQQAAFSLGTAGSAAEQTSSAAKEILAVMKAAWQVIKAFIDSLPTKPSEAVAAAADRGREAGRAVAGDTVADLAEDAWDIASLKRFRR